MSRISIITARYRPDLIGEHFHIDKPSLTPGENFNIQFSVANRKVYNDSRSDASSSPVKLYLSKDLCFTHNSHKL